MCEHRASDGVDTSTHNRTQYDRSIHRSKMCGLSNLSRTCREMIWHAPFPDEWDTPSTNCYFHSLVISIRAPTAINHRTHEHGEYAQNQLPHVDAARMFSAYPGLKCIEHRHSHCIYEYFCVFVCVCSMFNVHVTKMNALPLCDVSATVLSAIHMNPTILCLSWPEHRLRINIKLKSVNRFQHIQRAYVSLKASVVAIHQMIPMAMMMADWVSEKRATKAQFNS